MTVKITKPALNLREELADLRKPSGIAGEALLRADSVQEQRDLINAGRKNLLINGSFDVNQRDNLTLDAAATSFTDNAYYLDRWRANVGGSLSFTQEYLSTNQPAGINGASYRCNIGSSGSGFVAFHQQVENHLRYAGLSLTLSAWVKSNTTLARMLAYDGVAFKHGATHSGSGQWEKLSVTFTVQDSPTILDCYFGTYFNGSVAHNTGDYIEATQMQLELGSVATEFEHRSYGEELALCQRYFERSNTSGTAGTHRIAINKGSTGSNYYFAVPYKVTKRVMPTITINQIYNSDLTMSYHAAASTDSHLGLKNALGGNTNTRALAEIHWTADAEL